MATYWLSFRIKDDATYSERYNALVETVRVNSSKWWLETSSFFVFNSSDGIDDLATAVKYAIDEAIDIVLIGMPDFKSARLIGANKDQDIFALIPFVKAV